MPRKPSQRKKAKVTEQDVRDIRALRAGGALYREITERYGIKAPALHDMTTRKTWKHVH